MSEVTICNLALSHLGDTAAVASIRPPDSSIQAQLCARFYPMARNSLLEMGQWGFATKRIQPAQVPLPTYTDADGNTEPGTWRFAYAVPADLVNAIAVLSPDALNDYEMRLGPSEFDYYPVAPEGYVPVPAAPTYTPRPFAMETLQDGTQIILTNVPSAVLRYTAQVTDTTNFSSLFTLALSYLLASMLAGPLIKGDAGAALGTQMLQLFNATRGQASSSDANQRKTNVQPSVSWIRGR